MDTFATLAPDEIITGEDEDTTSGTDSINDDVKHLSGTTVNEELVIFVSKGEGNAKGDSYDATEEVPAITEDDATDGE